MRKDLLDSFQAKLENMSDETFDKIHLRMTEWSAHVFGMIHMLVDDEVPFYLLIDSDDSNFDNPLPSLLTANSTTLFHISGDTIHDTQISEDMISIKFIIDGENGGSSSHYYDISKKSCGVRAIIQDIEGKPHEPMYIMPKLHEVNMRICEADSLMDELKQAEHEQQQHSINQFLKNPANDKFFKK
jgi:hypothetical protein